MDRVPIALSDVLQRQHGCVARRQLVDAGFTPRQIDHRVASGLLIPCSRSVYRTVTAGATAHSNLWAAHLALPGSTVSHRSATWWHGLADAPERPELSIPMALRGAPSGVIVHRRRVDLTPRTVVVAGLRVTRPEVTVLEMSAVQTDSAFTLLVDRFVGGDARRLDRLVDWFPEVCGPGCTGSARARRELQRRVGGDIAESRLERRFLEVIGASSLPAPELQWTPPWNPRIRADAAWPAARVIVELDGRSFHSSLGAFERDRQRDQEAAAHGWVTIRFTWADLRDARRVVRVIADALSTSLAPRR